MCTGKHKPKDVSPDIAEDIIAVSGIGPIVFFSDRRRAR
jgi:hypothetical protein